VVTSCSLKHFHLRVHLLLLHSFVAAWLLWQRIAVSWRRSVLLHSTLWRVTSSRCSASVWRQTCATSCPSQIGSSRGTCRQVTSPGMSTRESRVSCSSWCSAPTTGSPRRTLATTRRVHLGGQPAPGSCETHAILASSLHAARTETKRRSSHSQTWFELLTAMIMKSSVFWDIMSSSPIKVNRRFRGTSRLHFQGPRVSLSLSLVSHWFCLFPRKSQWQ
jgi:hypothetical protein